MDNNHQDEGINMKKANKHSLSHSPADCYKPNIQHPLIYCLLTIYYQSGFKKIFGKDISFVRQHTSKPIFLAANFRMTESHAQMLP